jgi:hypothetical protein
MQAVPILLERRRILPQKREHLGSSSIDSLPLLSLTAN